MDVRKCQECGELYSVSYKRCPFCEEEEMISRGKNPARRGGGRRVAAKEPSVLGPVMIIVLLLLAALLVYFFFGDQLAQSLGFGDDSAIVEDEVTPDDTLEDDVTADDTQVGDDVTPGDDIVPPEVGDDTTPPEDGDVDAPVVDDPVTEDPVEDEPATVPVLSREDFTLDLVGNTFYNMTVAGGKAPYTWKSSNEAIAKVDANGTVTAVSGGNATITVTDADGTTAECVVRVKGAESGSISLSHSDITMKKGEKVALTLSGADAGVWSVGNSSVATVDGNGNVTGVSKGQTTLTVTVGNLKAECIIRVK